MTLNQAIMELVMIALDPEMPDTFKPRLQKVIETISELDKPVYDDFCREIPKGR